MNTDLRAKIIELFEYRRLPQLIKHSTGVLDRDFYEQLIDLQASIYHLDHELETRWVVDPKLLKKRWGAIHQDLKNIGVSSSRIDSYCKHIYKYQKHELELREHRLPMRLSMEYFYFYKSCDVKLLRKLIYDKYPNLHQLASLSSWRLFDLVTEIDDDIEDLYEDMTTINGNRFLLSLLKSGVKVTTAEFVAFLESLRNRLENSDYRSMIGHEEWTASALVATTALLEVRVSNVDMSVIFKSEVASHLALVGV